MQTSLSEKRGDQGFKGKGFKGNKNGGRVLYWGVRAWPYLVELVHCSTPKSPSKKHGSLKMRLFKKGSLFGFQVDLQGRPDMQSMHPAKGPWQLQLVGAGAPCAGRKLTHTHAEIWAPSYQGKIGRSSHELFACNTSTWGKDHCAVRVENAGLKPDNTLFINRWLLNPGRPFAQLPVANLLPVPSTACCLCFLFLCVGSSRVASKTGAVCARAFGSWSLRLFFGQTVLKFRILHAEI